MRPSAKAIWCNFPTNQILFLFSKLRQVRWRYCPKWFSTKLWDVLLLQPFSTVGNSLPRPITSLWKRIWTWLNQKVSWCPYARFGVIGNQHDTLAGIRQLVAKLYCDQGLQKPIRKWSMTRSDTVHRYLPPRKVESSVMYMHVYAILSSDHVRQLQWALLWRWQSLNKITSPLLRKSLLMSR